ncbi:hypothetical protein [Nocardioides sp. TF02-7]|uniref:hypothetical protein n=1 Tax=Nocardioides sp. TF02-7 TaxID=2917724 RepID=UPI001F054B43|nr:hypothetical protein [Nocardioides sp. TF02-7]UMG93905.1 hypothetical protein MF408_07270 [Nocardioides sp. TF02-7]
MLRRRDADRWEEVTEPTAAYTTARWLGPGTLLLVRPGRPTTWSTLGLDGRPPRVGPPRPERPLARRRLAPEPGAGRYRQPVVLHGWGRTPPALWTPGRRPVPLPRGWTNACLSPDGRRVLLVGRDRIGVTDAAGRGGRAVAVVADPAPHVLSCAWVDRRFGAG